MPLINPILRPQVCEGRLTLTTALPVPVSDQTAKTTVYFTPYLGSRIALFNGVSWKTVKFAEVSLAVPSTVNRLFDMFVYDNGGVITLEAVSWNQSSGGADSITAATAAAQCQVTDTAHGLSNGNLVFINGIVGTLGTDADNGLNGKLWAVEAVAANTFECDGSDTTGLTYTSGGTWYTVPNTRATAITLQDGVYVQSGATNKRYLGTLMTTATSGQCEDSKDKRLVWNYYNRVLREFYKVEDSTSWTYSSATIRPMNNSTANRVGFVLGVAEELWWGEAHGKFFTTVDANGAVHISANNVANYITTALPTHSVATAATYEGIREKVQYNPSVGYYALQIVEAGHGSGTQTFYGENSSGISGHIFG